MDDLTQDYLQALEEEITAIDEEIRGLFETRRKLFEKRERVLAQQTLTTGERATHKAPVGICFPA